jgi:hypothetical protein
MYNKSGGEGDEVSKEDMIAFILLAEEQTSFKFGNRDKDKKYDLSILKVPADCVVVRHFQMVALANGQQMEDPTTNRFQVYDKVTFDSMNSQNVKNGKQEQSQFEQLGINVDVLHMP